MVGRKEINIIDTVLIDELLIITHQITGIALTINKDYNTICYVKIITNLVLLK